MTWRSAEQIADALLYEGYLLYPYRGSAVKNRYRWQFGIVAPRDYGAAGGSEPWLMQTQCVMEPGAAPVLDVKVRFLQVEARQVEAREPASAASASVGRDSGAGEWVPVESLDVDGRQYVTWDEAVPRDITLQDVRVGDGGAGGPRPFHIPGGREVEEIRDAAGDVVARVTRERWPISGVVDLDLDETGGLWKVSVRVENQTPWAGTAADRPGALRRSLIAAHMLLAVRDGAFVSLLDPPEAARAAAAECVNLHAWPVLVGYPPGRDLMLASPIILYDYPRVAPESPGDLFDATEIDELLTLRLMTLTDEERREALATDPRAGHVVDRARSLPTEQLERLHGAIRYLGTPVRADPDPANLEAWLNPPGSDDEHALDAAGQRVGKGSRVRLRPAGRADAQDMFLARQTATVAAVYRDLEGRAHVAVMVDAGGAADLHESNGRFFYFGPDEVEVIDPGTPAAPGPAPVVGARPARVLVAGIGNVFLGDDGFGSAVAERLARRALPDGVRVEDFGIRSVHLAYDLLDAEYDTVILIDALSRGGAPGTLYVVEPEVEGTRVALPDGHTLDVESVLSLLEGIGGKAGRVLIVGCEPASLSPEMGLSEPVAAAVDSAAELVVDILEGRAG